MNTFLGELGKRLAERWLTLLVLPGVLYLAVAFIARALGQAHPTDTARVSARITSWSKTPAATTTAGQVLLLATTLAAAAAVGLASASLGAGFERLVLAADWHTWPAPFQQIAASRTESRQKRWDRAHREYSRLYRAAAPASATPTAEEQDRRRAALRTRRRIAAERPSRPTWSGDRVNAVAARLDRDRHLDLGVLWPHLWLAMPEQSRAEVNEASQSLSRAATLGAWGLLYAALAIWSWPALIIAAALALTARNRMRASTDAYAALIEAAAKQHAGNVARNLGMPPDTDINAPTSGDALMRLLRATDPPLAPPAEADPDAGV